MKLENATPVPAHLFLNTMDPDEPRTAMLVAKATFRFDANGQTTLEKDDPIPIFFGDEATDLGDLPRDDLSRADDAFEVILLGAAYASPGTAITSRNVSLSVGDVSRELVVFGDRVWESPDDAPEVRRASEPQPFARIPITWSRAFGGQVDVEIDRESFVPIADPHNRAGRGIDPRPEAEELCEMLGSPDDYPKFDPVRPFPNVERPDELVEDWEDAPMPACWATVPMDSAMHAERALEIGDPDDPDPTLTPEMWHRAVPEWVIDFPPERAPVVLTGLTPLAGLRFELPDCRVLVDCRFGAETSVRELAPQTLVLLPDEKRFYLTYRTFFRYPFVAGEERSVRLRLDQGWYRP